MLLVRNQFLLKDRLATILFKKNETEKEIELKSIFRNEDQHIKRLKSLATEISEITKIKGQENENIGFFKFIFNMYLNDRFSNPIISNFIIYSPEQSSLRKFEETTQIYPLGIKGEGLFQYLKELALNKKNYKILNEIKHNLILLDWFEDFDLPDNLLQNEFALKIKDKYYDKGRVLGAMVIYRGANT